MKNKIFISINIPQKFKKRLLLVTEKWQELPIKWTREAGLHIILTYLGFVDEEVISKICEKVSRTCEDKNIFDIQFDQIELFPSNSEPKAVALTGKPSEELKDIVNSIEKELGISASPKKSFRPHIKLGRIRKNKWETLENKPEITEKFPLLVAVNSVDIVSNKLDEEKDNYTTLESCQLQ